MHFILKGIGFILCNSFIGLASTLPLKVIFHCLHITLFHYHHHPYLSEGIAYIKYLSGIFCRVCLKSNQFPQLSFMEYMGLCLSLTISPAIAVIICALYYQNQFVNVNHHALFMIIGIDHDTVCAGVVGTAIRNSTSCAGRRAAACGRHNECCSGLQYQPRQRRPYKWSISILPRSQFYKKQGKLAFSTSCTAVRHHRPLRNDAWRRDS